MNRLIYNKISRIMRSDTIVKDHLRLVIIVEDI
jgi:hypothetical protein